MLELLLADAARLDAAASRRRLEQRARWHELREVDRLERKLCVARQCAASPSFALESR